IVAPSEYKAIPQSAVQAPLRPENTGYLLIGFSGALKRMDGMTLIASEGFNPRLADMATDAISKLWGTTTKLYGNARKVSPIFVLHQEATQPGSSYHGDVTQGSMVRLSFFGSDWKEASLNPERLESMQKFVAHELIHVVQSGIEHSPPWVNEGNAEFLSLLALFESGTTSIERSAQRLRAAFNSCITLTSSAANWQMFEQMISAGDGPYSCGLTLHVLAAGRGPVGKTAVNWRLFFEHHGSSPLLLPDDSEQAKPTSQWLAALLQNMDIRLSAASPIEKVKYGSSLLRATIRGLMQDTCSGAYGFSLDSESIQTDDLAACGQLASRRILRINDVALTKPWDAAMKLRNSCFQD
ncbi:MAG: hypothetical protein ACKO15_08765, partial [Burkholderiales bacterium]